EFTPEWMRELAPDRPDLWNRKQRSLIEAWHFHDPSKLLRDFDGAEYEISKHDLDYWKGALEAQGIWRDDGMLTFSNGATVRLNVATHGGARGLLNARFRLSHPAERAYKLDSQLFSIRVDQGAIVGIMTFHPTDAKAATQPSHPAGRDEF